MESTDSKKECGAFVVLMSGKRYLFDETATWAWDVDMGLLRVMEQGKVALEVPRVNVSCVGGHTWFFKDAWWVKE